MSRITSIRALPEHVRAQIKSSAIINSINDVAIGLLKNALDAYSSNITITIDYSRGGCDAEDNGIGIPFTAFEEGGGLGRMHHTSKFPRDSDTHGQYGQFLASVSALSIMTITSRQPGVSKQPLVSFHRSGILSRYEDAPDSCMLIPHAHGTTVSIKSLFGNLPVRIKQRALRYDSSTAETTDLDELKKKIVSILLPWPQKCKVILTERGRGKKSIFNSQHLREHVSDSGPEKDGFFHLPSICTLFRQAGYIQHSEALSWTVVSARSPGISIRAAISLDPSPTKQTQFASIGTHPLDSYQNAAIFDEINSLFSYSDFGAIEDGDTASDGNELCGGPEDERFTDTGPKRKQSKGLAKGVNKWPMCFIKIDLEERSSLQQARNVGEIFPDSSQSIQRVLDLLRSLVWQFLEQNHFRPKIRRFRKHERSATKEHQKSHIKVTLQKEDNTSEFPSQNLDPPRPHTNPRSKEPTNGEKGGIHTNGYQNWSRIKSSNPTASEDLLSGLPKRECARSGSSTESRPTQSCEHGIASEISLRSEELLPTGTLCTPEHKCIAFQGSHQMSPNSVGDAVQAWTDPLSHQKVLINTRTGQVMPDSKIIKTAKNDEKGPKKSQQFKTQQMINLRRMCLPRASNDAARRFLQKTFQGWENPAFSGSELAIPRANLDSLLVDLNDAHPAGHSISSGCTNTTSQPFEQPSDSLGAKLCGSNLKNATVLGQVDQKFILLKMNSSSYHSIDKSRRSPVLALVDQHAADERCKIEQLLSDLFDTSDSAAQSGQTFEGSLVRVLHLPKPITFNASAKEAKLFEQRASYFLSWGICCKLHVPPPASASLSNSAKPLSLKVVVTSVPSLIAERVRLHPQLLVDLLREDVWSEKHRPLPLPAVAAATPTDPNPTPSAAVVDSGSDSERWVRHLSTLPRPLLDLLCSRACRSAIMFNDVLTREECAVLLRKLARCRFPFVCAHGRPSLVVLGAVVEGIGGGAGEGWKGDAVGARGNEQGGTSEDAAKWRDWLGVGM